MGEAIPAGVRHPLRGTHEKHDDAALYLPMITVACVLKSGGDFDVRDVWALQEGVTSHLHEPHRFVCLSDVDIEGVDTIPLVHGWPGWWSKMELCRPGAVMGPLLFCDLDMVIIDDLAPLISDTSRS